MRRLCLGRPIPWQRAAHPDWAFVRRIGIPAALFTWFFLLSAPPFLDAVAVGLGGDARLYAQAARAWLEGGDPWRAGLYWPATGQTVYIASTPPTLLFFAPFAYLPAWLTGAAWITGDAVAMLFVVRRLHLPPWYLVWPPFVAALQNGNPEPVMLALLVLGAGALAPLVKPYALLPLAGERRWRALAAGVFLTVATMPLLPWGTFVADRLWIEHVLAAQNGWHGDAWVFPVLAPITLLALLSFGWRRAAWLAIPALLPGAQIHYALIAVPALSPLLAVAAGASLPGAFAVAVIIEALRRATRRGRRARPANGRLRLDSAG